MMPIYFDNAATSPLRKEVIDSINEVLLETYGNLLPTTLLVEKLRL